MWGVLTEIKLKMKYKWKGQRIIQKRYYSLFRFWKLFLRKLSLQISYRWTNLWINLRTSLIKGLMQLVINEGQTIVTHGQRTMYCIWMWESPNSSSPPSAPAPPPLLWAPVWRYHDESKCNSHLTVQYPAIRHHELRVTWASNHRGLWWSW